MRWRAVTATTCVPPILTLKFETDEVHVAEIGEPLLTPEHWTDAASPVMSTDPVVMLRAAVAVPPDGSVTLLTEEPMLRTDPLVVKP